jgi:hypothetical protein
MKTKVQNGMIKINKTVILSIILSTIVMINYMSQKFHLGKMLALSMSHQKNLKIKKLKLCVKLVFKLNMSLSSVNIIKKGSKESHILEFNNRIFQMRDILEFSPKQLIMMTN